MHLAGRLSKVTTMADERCSDVVRVGGDLGLAAQHAREQLATHLTTCRDCASYVAQITTVRDLLRARRALEAIGNDVTSGSLAPFESASPHDTEALRETLLGHAALLDPAQAEDLTQQTVEVGLALERADCRPRRLSELAQIMHALAEAQVRFDGGAAPAADATAAAGARADLLDGLDSDADEPELYYPDLYSGDALLDGWADSPNQWRGGRQILGPEEVDETREVSDLLDQVLSELPEPLGELLGLVDIAGHDLDDAAGAVGLDPGRAAAALARARNHVRGRVHAYLTGVDSAAQVAHR